MNAQAFSFNHTNNDEGLDSTHVERDQRNIATILGTHPGLTLPEYSHRSRLLTFFYSAVTLDWLE